MYLGAKTLKIDTESALHMLRQCKTMPEGEGWDEDFPEVVNHTSTMKARSHPDFEAAKHGDFDAAIRLVDSLVKLEKVLDISQHYPNARIAYIHCKEGLSANMIPAAYASMFAAMGMNVEDDIVAVNKVSHTNSSDLARMSKRLRFEGKVTEGADYIILDDFITSGAELRDLKDYISSKGGHVVMMTTLGHGSFGQLKNIGINEDYKTRLKEAGITDRELSKYGIASEVGCLTLSEAAKINRMVVSKTNRRSETIVERLSSLRKDNPDIQEVAGVVKPAEVTGELNDVDSVQFRLRSFRR